MEYYLKQINDVLDTIEDGSLKRFYLFGRERERENMHSRGRGRSKGKGRLPAEQGAQFRAQSQDPEIMT